VQGSIAENCDHAILRSMQPAGSLPDLDILNREALKALIVSQQDQLRAKEEQLQARDQEIEHLKLLLAQLRRMQFGRKSEKLARQIEQLELKLENLQTERAEPDRTAGVEVRKLADRAGGSSTR